MKKLALVLCLLAVSFTAQAQFEKGTMILNPSVTGLDFSYSKNDDAKFGIGAQVRGSIQNVAWTKCRTKYVKPLVHR